MNQDVQVLLQENLLESVQALLDKERRLMEMQIMEKDKELMELRALVKTDRKHRRRLDEDGPKYREGDNVNMDSDESQSDYEKDTSFDMNKDRIGFSFMDNLVLLKLRDAGLNEISLLELSKALLNAPNVKEIDFSKNNLGDGSANVISNMISNKNLHIEVMILAQNRFTLDPARLICSSISRSRTFRFIDISQNPFDSDPESGHVLGTALSKVGNNFKGFRITITDPKRDRNSGTLKGNICSFLNPILKSQNAISSIGVVHTDMNKSAVAMLASLGLENASLDELDLSMGMCGGTGATIIAKGMLKGCQAVLGNTKKILLHQPRTLQKLVLRMNCIGQSGCAAICNALAQSWTLKYIDLSQNELDDYCAGMIAKTLATTKSPLAHLDLSYNEFFRDTYRIKGSEALIDAVVAKPELCFLGDSDHLYFSVTIRRRLLSALSVNQRKRAATQQQPTTTTNAYTKMKLFEDMNRRTIGTGNEQILHLEIPDTITKDEEAALTISWQINKESSWDLIRVRGSTKEVVARGEKPTSAPGGKQRTAAASWIDCVAEADNWFAGDQVLLSVAACPPKISRYIQKIAVHAAVRPKPRRPGVIATTDPTKEIFSICKRDWKNNLLLPQAASRKEIITNYFQPLHRIYLHFCSPTMLLRWHIRLVDESGESLSTGQILSKSLIGVEWQISRVGDTSMMISGGADECRNESTNPLAEPEEYIQYTVDVSPLRLCFGEVIELRVRPADSILTDRKSAKPYAMESNFCHLMDPTAPMSVELNLADDCPFGVPGYETRPWA